MPNDPTHFCRVCGLRQPYPQYGEDGKNPTYEICVCCGVEFGYEDISFSGVRRFRDVWIEGGMRWFDLSQKPEGWSWECQSAFIPDEFR